MSSTVCQELGKKLAEQTIPFVERKILNSGEFVVSVKVPKSAQLHTFDYPNERRGIIRYAKWVAYVCGGVVNFYVHAPSPAFLLGKRIISKVVVWERKLSDGRRYLCVDLIPSPTAKVTHRMVVMPSKALSSVEGTRTFETPAPLVGTLAFGPPDAKFAIR